MLLEFFIAVRYDVKRYDGMTHGKAARYVWYFRFLVHLTKLLLLLVYISLSNVC